MMGVQLHVILTACIVNFASTSDPTYDQVIPGGVEDQSKLRENFQYLFDSIADNHYNAGKDGRYREVLKDKVKREQKAFDAINEEFQVLRHLNANRKTNGHKKLGTDENVIAVKRETKGEGRRKVHTSIYNTERGDFPQYRFESTEPAVLESKVERRYSSLNQKNDSYMTRPEMMNAKGTPRTGERREVRLKFSQYKHSHLFPRERQEWYKNTRKSGDCPVNAEYMKFHSAHLDEMATKPWPLADDLTAKTLKLVCDEVMADNPVPYRPLGEFDYVDPPTNGSVQTERVVKNAPIVCSQGIAYAPLIHCSYNGTDFFLAEGNETHVFKLGKDPTDELYYFQSGTHVIHYSNNNS